jgi:hypothetical protein
LEDRLGKAAVAAVARASRPWFSEDTGKMPVLQNSGTAAAQNDNGGQEMKIENAQLRATYLDDGRMRVESPKLGWSMLASLASEIAGNEPKASIVDGKALEVKSGDGSVQKLWFSDDGRFLCTSVSLHNGGNEAKTYTVVTPLSCTI